MKKERTTTKYFPRSRFWRFWEKRRPSFIMVESDAMTTVSTFYEDGKLRSAYLQMKSGEEIETTYYPNEMKKRETVITGDEVRDIRWGMEGDITFNQRIDRKTGIETHYYPNGNLQLRHDPNTGEYEEYTVSGKLKKKGHWVDEKTGKWLHEDGKTRLTLNTCGTHFETGNMRQKLQDAMRQRYNAAIDAVNQLSATEGRKAAKEALVQAYREERKKEAKKRETAKKITAWVERTTQH